MAQLGRPRKNADGSPTTVGTSSIWVEDYEKICDLSVEFEMPLYETLAKVLTEHKRTDAGEFIKRRGRATTHSVGVTSESKAVLKNLREYYGGTQVEVINYVLKTREGD